MWNKCAIYSLDKIIYNLYFYTYKYVKGSITELIVEQ